MNPLGEQVLQIAKEYLGPAAPQFLSKELRALECTADTVTPLHLQALSQRARAGASRIMDAERSDEFGLRVAMLAGPTTARAAVSAPTVRTKEGSSPRLSLDAAAKLYSSGKLRQAEEAYRQLTLKHGDVESYRGLAQTQVALEDVGAAVLGLRDGAAGLARKGDRSAAIALLSEAVRIAPGDLAAHRRLAAAHANAGDAVSACAEYERYVDYALAEGDSRRAWLELTYARETLGDLPGLVRLVDRLVPTAGVAPVQPRPTAPSARAVSVQVSPPPPQPPEIRRLVPAAPPAPQRTVTDDDLPRTRPVGSLSTLHLQDARTVTSVDAFDEAPVDLAARIAPRSKEAVRKAEQAAWKSRPAVDIEATLATLVPGTTPGQQAAVSAMRASILISARDPRATETAIDAARRLLSLHLLQAASDLLLDYIAAGYTDREAQRLLIEVDCGLGRRDVARDKCRLLGTAYRLDGRADRADDVERLAAII
jgi:tetratricopeptide (TPR) repeat protein